MLSFLREALPDSLDQAPPWAPTALTPLPAPHIPALTSLGCRCLMMGMSPHWARRAGPGAVTTRYPAQVWHRLIKPDPYSPSFFHTEPVHIWRVALEETLVYFCPLSPSCPAAFPDHRMKAVRPLREAGKGAGRGVRTNEAWLLVSPSLTLGNHRAVAARQRPSLQVGVTSRDPTGWAGEG